MAVGQHNLEDEKEELAEGTLISHLVELRQRLVRAVLAIFVIFIVLVPFSQEIFEFVSRPLQDALPENSSFIVTGVATPFLTPFKTTLFVALFAAMPVVLYQAWQFVAPGLYRRERRFAVPLVVSSILLFYAGVAFAYFVVFKLVFGFFVGVTPENVVNSPDIDQYLGFVLRLFFAFGLAFEVPIATFMLVWSRLVSIETLGKARAYVFLGAFIVGMFLTPPDVFSQTLLAIPIYLLYESGLILARLLLRERLAEAAAEAATDAAVEADDEDAPSDDDTIR
ncbi:MAG: twin-arginine translocase subunit TatC [Gammaproteobacteria bacterium]|nr:twin-arginine translocase subunit TatC [Gammaproteobacteria bacterium]